jgi:hypothetical protein
VVSCSNILRAGPADCGPTIGPDGAVGQRGAWTDATATAAKEQGGKGGGTASAQAQATRSSAQRQNIRYPVVIGYFAFLQPPITF